jgi:hypothetical protein
MDPTLPSLFDVDVRCNGAVSQPRSCSWGDQWDKEGDLGMRGRADIQPAIWKALEAG